MRDLRGSGGGEGLRQSPESRSLEGRGDQKEGLWGASEIGEDCGGRKWERLREATVTVSVVVRGGIVPV